MRVTVYHIDLVPGSSIAYGSGEDEQGNPVRFAGDWRPMRDIALAIGMGGPVEADVPEWSLL